MSKSKSKTATEVTPPAVANAPPSEGRLRYLKWYEDMYGIGGETHFLSKMDGAELIAFGQKEPTLTPLERELLNRYTLIAAP